MSTRIPYDTASATGQLLAELMNETASVRAKAQRLKDMFESMADGADYTQIETEVGGMTVGDGQATYNIVVGMTGELTTNNLAATSRLDNG